jgi:LAO/AO transport system kinase
MAPGMGDEVQAIKAGILECADVFAVNKADRDGADAAVRDLELMIALGNETVRAMSKVRGHTTHSAADAHAGPGAAGAEGERWTPPIVKCVATRGEGIDGVVAALDAHRAWVEGSEAGRARREARLREEVREGLREALIDAAVHDLGTRLDEAVHAVDSRTVDPYTATERLVAEFRAR